MKITETILAQLTDTETLLESVYLAISEVDPNYNEEMAAYEQAVHTLLKAVPDSEIYLEARRKELASDIRFAMWQGFQWSLNCHRDPIYKLMAKLDFEELCQESRMHTLPDAQTALQRAQTFVHSLPEDKRELLDPISDHYAYLKTWGYKLAFCEGFRLADSLLPHLVPGYAPELMLSTRLEQKLWDSLGVAVA